MRAASLCSVLLLAACGGTASTPGDADPGSPDEVKVTVTQGGQPLAALSVTFLEADGTVAATALTDAAGIARAALHAGGSVTVAHPSPPASADAFRLESWTAVQPGDALTLDLPAPSAGMNLQVTAPVASLSGVMSYRAVTPCGASDFFLAGHSAQLSLWPNCTVAAGTTDVMVFAQGANEHDVAALVAPDLAVADGQALAVTGDYQPLATVPVTFAHVGSASYLSMEIHALSDRGQTPVANTELSGSNGSFTGSFAWPAQLTSGTRVIETAAGPDPSGIVFSWAPIGSPVAIDLAGMLLQPVTSQATFDPDGQHIRWTLGADGAAADLAVAAFEISRDDGTYVGWTIVSPGAAPEIAVPPLPASVVTVVHPDQIGVSLTTLHVPGGAAARTSILGPGGLRAGFAALIAASPTGAITEAQPPGIPL